ncbi:TfoX/Sxy family protein [Candidatus Woesebacteria bacterium]|nr:TfoX/Sxy family protein [Candidatus Woesebacteria bacterium]
MSTSADTIIYLSDQLTSLGSRIRTRKMFGEYAMYCDERVVALICDDQLFVKITDPGKLFVGSKYEEGFPYPGAKPAILVGGDIIENKEAFAQLIDITAKAVPMPKPKKPKVKKV